MTSWIVASTPSWHAWMPTRIRSPLDGVVRHVQHVSGFFHAQTAEEAQLDDFRLARIHRGQCL
jgi:hypothetical protein